MISVRVSSYDQKDQKIEIDEICHLPDQEQAELIADKFSSIPNEYEPLKSEEISF